MVLVGVSEDSVLCSQGFFFLFAEWSPAWEMQIYDKETAQNFELVTLLMDLFVPICDKAAF